MGGWQPFHVAWQGNFEQWVLDPLHTRPIAHAIWDPHFGQGLTDALTQAGATSPVNIAYSGLYHWWYTIGMRTNEQLFQVRSLSISLFVGYCLQDGFIFNLSTDPH